MRAMRVFGMLLLVSGPASALQEKIEKRAHWTAALQPEAFAKSTQKAPGGRLRAQAFVEEDHINGEAPKASMTTLSDRAVRGKALLSSDAAKLLRLGVETRLAMQNQVMELREMMQQEGQMGQFLGKLGYLLVGLILLITIVFAFHSFSDRWLFQCSTTLLPDFTGNAGSTGARQSFRRPSVARLSSSRRPTSRRTSAATEQQRSYRNRSSSLWHRDSLLRAPQLQRA